MDWTTEGQDDAFPPQSDESMGVEESDDEYWDDLELPPRGYAHYNGLAVDYLQESPFDSMYSPSCSAKSDADLLDPPSVPSVAMFITLGALDSDSFQDKLDVDRDTIEFLGSLCNFEEHEQLERLIGSDDRQTFSDLKIEEALLPSDPAIDLLRLKERNVVTISTDGLELFDLNAAKDESLVWSARQQKSWLEIENETAAEKLQIDSGIAEYLKMDIMGMAHMTTNETLVKEVLPHKTRMPEPVTPPLMPISPPFKPSELPESVAYMELTSTPEDLPAREAAKLRHRILKLDDEPFSSTRPHSNVHAAETDPKDIYSPLRTPATSPSPLPRKRLRDFEVDVPLLPQSPLGSPAKKMKTMLFQDELQSKVLLSEPDEADLLPSDDVQDFMNDIIAPLAAQAIEQAKHEELTEIDTTMRVKVPHIDTTEFVPPWEASRDHGSGLAAQQALLAQIKTELKKSETKWGGVSQLEHFLPWRPFQSHLGKISIVEEFDDGSLTRYLAEEHLDGSEERLDLSSLICRSVGRLSILDVPDDDEEELERVAFETCKTADDSNALPIKICSPTVQPHVPPVRVAPSPVKEKSGVLDMQALLKRRKMELESTAPNAKQSSVAQISPNKPTRTPFEKGETLGARSTRGGLTDFMHLQGQPLPQSDGMSKQQSLTFQSTTRRAAVIEPTQQRETKLSRPSAPVPVPKSGDTSQAFCVVLDSKLLTNHQLIRQIQTNLPKVDFIERNGHASDPNGSGRAEISYEADITISPGTGMLLSSIQMLKQKALPGDNRFVGIRERVAAVSIRYERLIVLVSEGQQAAGDDPSLVAQLDDRDTEVLSDLIGFTAALQSDVEVYYVAGGDRELVQWIVALISRHAILMEDTDLLHDETIQEHILRRVGLNAFAAQVILAKLKMLSNDDRKGNGNASMGHSHSLAAFMQMTADERLERFGQLMGGHRVLRGISETIDGKFVAEAGVKR